jgi:hypothetical protein
LKGNDMKLIAILLLAATAAVATPPPDALVNEYVPNPKIVTVYAQTKGGITLDIPHFESDGDGKQVLPGWWDAPLVGKEETGVSLNGGRPAQTIPGPTLYRHDLWSYCKATDKCKYGFEGAIGTDATATVNGERWQMGDPVLLKPPSEDEGKRTLRFAGWVDVTWSTPNDQDVDYRLNLYPYMLMRYYREYKSGYIAGVKLDGQRFGPHNLPADSGTVMQFKLLASERVSRTAERWYLEGSIALEPDTDWFDCADTSWGEGTGNCVSIDHIFDGGPRLVRWGLEWGGEMRQCCSPWPDGRIYHVLRFFVEEDQPKADVNLDGRVNGLDVAAVKAPGVWMKQTREKIRADVNGDGQVNGLDVAVVRAAMPK